MSTNNTIIQDLDEIMDHPSTPPLPPPLVLLSFGNILNTFPEFLLQVLPYIADRIVWNSIASSDKMMYNKTRKDLPPWPKNFKLCVPGCDISYERPPVWSPDGTQVACIVGDHKSISSSRRVRYDKIVIFDRRCGLLRFRRHGDSVDNSDIGWIPHEQFKDIPNLKFSPDGSFLLSWSQEIRDDGADDGDNGIVKIWDYNTTGYYLQLQEWNISQELDEDISFAFEIDISPCSRYVVVLLESHILLKDVQNNGKTIKSVLLPENEYGHQVIFSAIDGHDFIFIGAWDEENCSDIIKIWYFDDEGDGPNANTSLITILRSCQFDDLVLSHDKSMIATTIYEGGENRNKVLLYSIENGNTSATRTKLILKHSFSARCSSIRFTPDDNYIVYENQNGLAFWNITTGRESTDNINIPYYYENKIIGVIDFSPAGGGQRLIVRDYTGGYYIASFLGK